MFVNINMKCAAILFPCRRMHVWEEDSGAGTEVAWEAWSEISEGNNDLVTVRDEE